MRVLFASAELAPVATVGGLAHAAAGLVAELRRSGTEVTVVLPDYGGPTGTPLTGERVVELDVAAWAGPARVRIGTHPVAGELHLVDGPGIARPHPYLQPSGEGWPDNDHRFLAFSQAVAALWRAGGHDVLHLNDWHTATTLAAIEGAPPSVLSIHNLAYQGWAGTGWLSLLGPRAAAFERHGAVNPLAGGLALADAIVAVSPTYAREILTPAEGCGLEELLASRGDAVVGILNGIDTDTWDPADDALLPARYDADDLTGKATARAHLLGEVGLPAGTDHALAVMVTRLVEQKGVDLLLPIVPFLAGIGARLVVLGSGEQHLVAGLRAAADRHPHHLAFVEGYDERLAHRLFAAGDLLLMPSRFEPCGLAQMQAMRYGTLPVVTGVGGLRDTVVDLDASADRGTGFVAERVDPLDLLDALHRGVRAWRDPRRRAAAQGRGMRTDWSWRAPAQRHVELYERVRRG